MFGRELRLPYDLLFGVPPDKELPTTDYATDLMDHLHDIHNYARQHLKLASDQMKTRHDKLANSAGYHEGDSVWLYSPTRTKGKSPKLQSSWDGPYMVVTRINDVVYRMQRNPRPRMMVVHLDRPAYYDGPARDEHG
jgi:anaerobic selenocysteine-containing dehydrogenase